MDKDKDCESDRAPLKIRGSSLMYEIMSINPLWILEAEQMGTKDKFWFRDPADPEERDWLFKYPTPGTGQHWSEKIAYEISKHFGILTPRVELALFDGLQGSATISFTKVKRDRVFEQYELFHGNQVLSGFDNSYDAGKRWRQEKHTIDRIFDSIRSFTGNSSFSEYCLQKLTEYLVFDALISNVDRHHENWGLLRKKIPKKNAYRLRLAPSFDHASSLGRELQDSTGKQNRIRYIEDLGISKYIERAHGPIFIHEKDKKGPSPLDLVNWGRKNDKYEKYFFPALLKVKSVKMDDINKILLSIPNDWITSTSRNFILSLVEYNLTELERFINEE